MRGRMRGRDQQARLRRDQARPRLLLGVLRRQRRQDHMKKLLPVITNSQMRVFRRCQKLAYFMYVLMYRAIEDADALRLGTLVHVGLEAWWRASENRLEAAIAAMAPRAFDAFELARAKVLVMGYDARWLADAPYYEVLSIEHVFRAPLLNPETGAPSRSEEHT